MFKDDLPREDRPFRRKRDDTLGLYPVKIGLSSDGSNIPQGAIAGQKIDFLLESLMSQRTQADDFDDLPIPFRAVAVDILSAEVVVQGEGRLATAMRASMSLPAVFDPVEVGDRLLVDGGVLMNLPVSVGKDMGADIVIAVDVGSPLESRDKVQNLLQVLYQLTGVVTVVNTREQVALLGEDDLLLVPPLGKDITTGNFAKSSEAIPIGYTEAMKHRSALSKLSLSESEWQLRQDAIAGCVAGPPVVEFLRVNNQSRFRDGVITSRLNVPLGQTINIESLEDDIQEIYSLGFIQSVQYSIVQDGDRTGIEIDVLPDSRGADFLEWGIGVSSTSRESNFNLRVGYLKTDVTNNGGEFRGLVQLGRDMGGLAELYLPFTDSLKYVLVPRFAFEESSQNIFDPDENVVAKYNVRQSVFDLAAGYEFSRDAALFAGVRFGQGSAEVAIGDPLRSPYDFDRGEYFIRGTFDSQDNRFFPGSGTIFTFDYTMSRKSLGADEDYDQLASRYMHAWTFDRHSMLAGFEYDISLDNPIPIQSLFQAGGFPRLSGFQYDQLVDENFGMVFTGYRYQLLEGSLFPGYVGGTVEYGNVARYRTDILNNAILNGSVYFGLDSLIGPLYLGMGFAEGGRHTVFLSIGSIFIGESLIR
jgi:NTE family protein